MAQHDYVISNQTFPLTRQDINNALASIVSNNSDATEPTIMYAYQWWFDTSTNTLKFRNADNDAWISFATFDMVNDTVNLVDSAVDIVTDLSPQLGANLDLNSNDITGTGNINITGNITASGNLAGTLTTASQTNITSVGTLTGLTVNGNLSVDGGTIKLDGNYPVGTDNVALGDNALADASTGDRNTAIGNLALQNNEGNNNTAVGYQTLKDNTTGTENVALGRDSLDANTSGYQNTGLGNQALSSNTTGIRNTTIGYASLKNNESGQNNTSIGRETLFNATNTDNTAVGSQSGYAVTTGTKNTFIGRSSGSSMTTGSDNVILGSFSGNSGGLDIRTSSNNIVLSDGDGNHRAVFNSDGDLGISGYYNTAVGAATNTGEGFFFSGDTAKYVFFGRNSAGANFYIAKTGGTTTGEGIRFVSDGNDVGSIDITVSSTSYNTSSDYRLKENVVEMTGATERLKQLQPKRFNFIADADTTVDGFLAHEVSDIVPEAITGTKDEVDADGNPVYQGIDQSKLVPLLVATIKELEARITALEGA